MSSFKLDTLSGLLCAIAERFETLQLLGQTVVVESLYCPRCSGHRRMTLRLVTYLGDILKPRYLPQGKAKAAAAGIPQAMSKEDEVESVLINLRRGVAPLLFTYTCVQCECLFTGVVYKGQHAEELALFSNSPAGIATANTPEPVAYYLDQAARCQSVGALSASVVMYRAALENILELAGYNERMLGPKLRALEEDLKNKAARVPGWAGRVDPVYLESIKKLGDGAIHSNGGDISLQGNLDGALVNELQVALEEILDHAYEKPLVEAARLQRLKAAAAALTPKKK
ncbi:hypothetical protein HI113_40685 [Corallococcus exiguus]|uniref:hypothetical protein n=1 Tax=Corallococcus exiguus TaxID=83462 RepID=UPI0014739501|nr:hypothetical protein [Corallococcus exiguus]NNC00203.1 hypothetical protein [Corallococcus exiguus]